MTQAVIAQMTTPCAQCPWRKSNCGKKVTTGEMPYGWYSEKNLRRLWSGLRTGEAPGMTCHPTDSDNPTPNGRKPTSDGVEKHECAGALLLIQRELSLVEKDLKGYLKARSRLGLTKTGIAWWGVSRGSLAGTYFGGPPMYKVNEDPDIQRPDVD